MSRTLSGNGAGLIVAKELGFTYTGGRRPAIENVSLSIGKEEFVLLTGPSGCGKSTLCRCFNGLIPNFYNGELTGELLIDGVSAASQLTSELSRKVGYVFQNPENQLFALTVEKDIAFGPENLGLPRGEIRRRVDWAMKITDTTSLKELAPYELSGGQQQRVALAGVLAMEPNVIVLDEPTSFLDPRTAEEVMMAVEGLRREQGITVIVVEHRLDLVARYAGRILVMDQGRIVADGELRVVLDQEFERLAGLGVGLPKVSLLWSLLRRDGLVSGPLPTQVDEAADSLSRRLDA
ncbi:MAG TPA: ABC transporter ATP-binding protein [Candidatus Bathyarchaeia archaeon]|nr:ABC transporter ATP-binding protein [Candidatus Bathyarchaeia archaeon]